MQPRGYKRRRKISSNQKTNKCHDIPWDENFIGQPYLNKQFSITQSSHTVVKMYLSSINITLYRHFLLLKSIWTVNLTTSNCHTFLYEKNQCHTTVIVPSLGQCTAATQRGGYSLFFNFFSPCFPNVYHIPKSFLYQHGTPLPPWKSLIGGWSQS